jgi:predicted nucleic acid-binding Zn ribbon protein
MSNHNQSSLGDAIDAYLRKNGLNERVKVEGVIAEWGRIMGTAIAENTEKVWYKDHILYLQISNPVWKNELGFAKTKIKDIVNREMGEPIVHEVKIV